MDNKKIKDTFLKHQANYFKTQGDMYTASQMGAIATESDLGITKEELIKALNN